MRDEIGAALNKSSRSNLLERPMSLARSRRQERIECQRPFISQTERRRSATIETDYCRKPITPSVLAGDLDPMESGSSSHLAGPGSRHRPAEISRASASIRVMAVFGGG